MGNWPGLPFFAPVVVLAASLSGVNAWALDIAPQVLIIDAEDHSGALLLRNGADAAVEIDVDLRFGFEVADERGDVRVHYPEQPSNDHRSAVPYLGVYPRRARLAPGEERVVRVLVRLPPGTAQGEYWARASVRAVPEMSPSIEPSDRIRLQVGVTSEQHIPVFVRNGRAAATAHIQDVTFEVATRYGRELLVARYFVGLEGSGAFLGTVHAVVQDADGDFIGRDETNLAVFESGWRRVEIPLDHAPAEGARLELRTERRHPAITSGDLLPGGVTKWSVAFASRYSEALTTR